MGALVLVSIYWGVEYQAGPSSNQKDIAPQLADAGAEVTTLIFCSNLHGFAMAEPCFLQLGQRALREHGLESTCQSTLVLVSLNPDEVAKFRTIPFFLIDVPNSLVVEAGDTDIESIMQYFL